MGVKTFRRYTNLAATIHLLRTKSITLLNPATWDDTNDAYYMAEYKRHSTAKSVLALCFTESAETYHHWRVFSHGRDGVCIEFDKERLLSVWAGDTTVVTGVVNYEEIRSLRKRKVLSSEQLPFLKRYPFRDEQEFRVVFTSMDQADEHKSYTIPLSCIKRVTLSPWMSKALATSVKQTLKDIPQCKGIKVSHSTLVDNEVWKSFTARIVDPLPSQK